MGKKIIDFSKYSSIKIGPKVEVYIIEKIEKDNEQLFIIGGANNLLVSPNPPKIGILSKKFDYIKIKNDTLVIGGATPSGKILSFCKKHNIKGFEFLTKLPGTLGAMVKMNAGVKNYEIGKSLLWIRTYRGTVPKKEINIDYRITDIENIIYEAAFKIEYGFDTALQKKLLDLRKNQPKEPSPGSCFKNPPGDYAGRLIEAVGLKGYTVGGAAFSEIHANFLVNRGDASFEDAIKLIELAKKRVYEKFGIVLKEEVVIL
ncbi:UDP-N-acetylmuramate dehydrogenase [Nitrosophilus alvini]|uniref:UDP-N-acetylmuramate dehydrogenase n=1 Tax=Nitrosophilus alvini TaxID=2714855 RepID=UPI00190DFD43|nr:UDP-N-acetylmuramate dehydrogenase [Nitrosophilus alvini]